MSNLQWQCPIEYNLRVGVMPMILLQGFYGNLSALLWSRCNVFTANWVPSYDPVAMFLRQLGWHTLILLHVCTATWVLFHDLVALYSFCAIQQLNCHTHTAMSLNLAHLFCKRRQVGMMCPFQHTPQNPFGLPISQRQRSASIMCFMMTEASLTSLMSTTTFFTVLMVDLFSENCGILCLILKALWILISCRSSTLTCMSLNCVNSLTYLTSHRMSRIRYMILLGSSGPSLIARA